MPTLASLLVQETKAAIYARGLALADSLGLTTTSWVAGDPTRSLYHFLSDGLSRLESLVSGYVTMDSQASFGITANGALNAFTTGTSTLYSVSTLDITTYDSATNALKIVDSALAAVAGQRSKFGALQARFENAINGLNITSENMAASRSRIQDADFAAETAALSRAQVLQQAGTAMVAQANQLPQQVLSLLKG